MATQGKILTTTNYQVTSISLVKFTTPMLCKKAGGVLNKQNDTHWAVLINNTTLVHMTGHNDVAIILEQPWNPQPNSPRPCRPYIFAQARDITVDSHLLLGIVGCNCQRVCKAIFALLNIEIMVCIAKLTTLTVINL